MGCCWWKVSRHDIAVGRKKFINLRGKILQARQVPLGTYADGTEKKTFPFALFCHFEATASRNGFRWALDDGVISAPFHPLLDVRFNSS